MKKVFLSSLLSLSIMSTLAMAQENQMGVPIGIGISFDGTGSTIKVPIDLDTIRVEPEVSFTYVDGDNTDTKDFFIGSGVYLQKNISNEINLYYGGRAGIGYRSYVNNSDTSFQIAGVVGMEYFMHKQVSLGGEVSLGLGFGDDTTVGTQTAVTLRYYL